MASEMPKGHQKIFKYFQQGSEVVEESSKIFGSRWDIFRNPGRDKIKSQTFDSEKVGRTIEHQPFKWKVLDLNYSWTIKQGL